MSATWDYPETAPMRVQGRGLAEDNFAQETKTPLSILIREAIQNPLDARREGCDAPPIFDPVEQRLVHRFFMPVIWVRFPAGLPNQHICCTAAKWYNI